MSSPFVQPIYSHAENLSELYDLYAPLLYGQVLACCQDEEEAGVLLNNIFIIAHDNWQTFDNRHSNAFAWILRILICHVRENGYQLTFMQVL